MKNKIMPTAVLSSICLVVALLLAVINLFTGPQIAANLKAKQDAALYEILGEEPGASAAPEKLTVPEGVTLPKGVTDVFYRESDGVFVIQAEVAGKSDGMIVMCGIDGEGKIIATKCIKNAETPGYAAPVWELTEDGQVYRGMTLGSYSEKLVSGSTLTSSAYARAVKAALDARELLKGGAADE